MSHCLKSLKRVLGGDREGGEKMLRSRGGHLQHACAPQDRYLFRTTSRLSPIGRAEDYRERETSEIRRRSDGSGPPLRTSSSDACSVDSSGKAVFLAG